MEIIIDKDTLTVHIPEGIDIIPPAALKHSAIKRVILPSTLKLIGNFAFSSCPYLEEVVLPPSCKIIKPKAFYNCVSLKSINLENVEHISSRAFEKCPIEKVNLNKALFIDNLAFKDTKIKEIFINKNVLLEPTALSLMPHLENIKIDKENRRYIFNNGNLVDIENSVLFLSLGYSIYPATYITSSAFSNFKAEVINISPRCKRLIGEVFYRCNFKKIILPPNVEFDYCTIAQISKDTDIYYCADVSQFPFPDLKGRIKFINDIDIEDLLSLGLNLKNINKLKRRCEL